MRKSSRISDVLQALSEADLAPPKLLTFGIIDQCNLNCQHCWPECGPMSPIKPVDDSTIISIVEEFTLIGGESLWLAGGETLLHPKWFEIISILSDNTSLTHLGLQTNSTLITEKIASQFQSIRHPGFNIQVSLDGATPKTHDFVRGEGNFEKAVEGLSILCEAGLADKVSIAFTEMRHNFEDLPLMLNLVEARGLKNLISNSLIKGGRAANQSGILPPEAAQVKSLARLYQTDIAFQDQYHRFANISAIEWLVNRNKPAESHCRCVESPYITPSGLMYPCVMYQHEAYAAKNIFRQSFFTTLLKTAQKWSELPRQYRHRKEALQPCKLCKGREHCGGGCMGRAMTASGDPLTVEDRCHLRKAIYYLEDD